ncbi:hypothetical protein BJ138DRAFT_358286 [Hygrophoropsis aurantiaca]|uniref:Uncharacterized protein n=1 Tax=Hygrophoropsis aurantiaca TaxID=72124 RepID=A0ACB8A4Z0_9AGAM|nr:hypothetical protein BJ138DRAFT_358286 [Hygrophoropsis aurantiaca]
MTETQADSSSELGFNIGITTSTEGTEDFPRESLGRVIVNYAPSVLIFLALVILPAALICRFTVQLFGFVGIWGYLLIFVAFGPTTMGFLLFQCRPCVLRSASWKVVACRTVWLLLHNVLLLALLVTVAWIPIHTNGGAWFLVLGDLLFLCVECYSIFCSWKWYKRCWYERVIISQNEELYGHTVFVSSPVIKLCGHYVIIIRDHKYELRLDAHTGNRPVFKGRSLQPSELEELRNAPGTYWSIIGWTRHEDVEVQAVFRDVIQRFGVYHRLHNNCRHFIHDGCANILTEHSEDDGVLIVGSLDYTPFLMIWLIWRSTSREIYRWGWTQWYGPEWESLSISGVTNFILLEDLRASSPYIPDWFVAVAPETFWEDLPPRPDDSWVSSLMRMLIPILCILLLIGYLRWSYTTANRNNFPTVLFVGFSVMMIFGVIAIMWLCVSSLQRSRRPSVALQ